MEGLPRDTESDAFKRRHKHVGGNRCSLSGALKDRLPKMDKGGLDILRNLIRGKDKSLPFKFFEECFPQKSQDIPEGGEKRIQHVL